MFYVMLSIVVFAVVFLIINYVMVIKQMRKADAAKTINIADIKSKKE